jgi:DNA-directed RNA polymerase specialized sigma24 family protein
MIEPIGHEITELLQAWRQGDERALVKLTPGVLHNSARRCMARERDAHALQPAALIDELYLRLSDFRDVDWQALALIDQRKSRVVELCFLGGLGVEETAEVLKVSPDPADRNWLAKAWLLRKIGQTDES